MSKIIALIDGSVYSQSVCDHAAWAAGRAGATVEVLHGLGRRDVPSAPANLSGNLDVDARDSLLADLASLDEQRAKLAQRRGRAILDDAKARLHADGVASVTTRLRHGDILEAVEAFEAEADLVVIGKRGEAADFAKLHLGSNLERIVRASHKPILVASRALKPIKRFLIAFDGGTSAMKAVDHVSRDPIFAGLECRALTVGEDTPETRRQLEAASAMLRAAGFIAQTGIIQGQADVEIAKHVEADQIDLLVMGAYGHSRIRSLIIGSTTSEMIRSCKIPILLIR